MTKMEQLASIFDKKLGEEFTIKYSTKHFDVRLNGKFTENGLEIEGFMPHEEVVVLNLLLKDKATIMEDN